MRRFGLFAVVLLLIAACGGCAFSMRVPRGYECPFFSDAHGDPPQQTAEAPGQAA
jgi:hypothetical protein